MPIAAAIYARISSDRDGQQLGVTRQLADCRALAARRGWPVAEVYSDDDRSAYSGKARLAYRRLLDDLRAGAVDAVVVWHLDRLHRQPKELEEFFEVCDAAGVTHLASVTGDVDLATHDGRFMARILGAVSRKESDDKSRRIRRKALELAQAGKIGGGGTRPYGYEPDRRTVRQSEAPIIREAAARILAGDSLRSVCNDLNARRVSTVTGVSWTPTQLKNMLVSPRVSGQREHRDEIVATAEWPAIITPDETARLRTLLRDLARRKNRTVRRYLLKGLLRCHACGSRLIARPRQDGARRYGCGRGPGLPGCGKTWTLAEPVETFVVDAVLYRLDTPGLAASLASPVESQTARDDADQLERDERQLDELATAYGERAVTLREYLAARKPIERRIDASRRRLSRERGMSALDGIVGYGPTLRARWSALPLARQHAIVAAVLNHVTVGPAVRGRNVFDASRLSPLWRV
jgi:site-specific DNA recombinase